MIFEERKALVKSYLGKTVDIKIDRPIGYVHKKENYSLTYPINYGYIPGVLGGDDITGDVNCGGDIKCKMIEGNVECQGNIIYN